MRIVCPKCDAEYQVQDRLLRPGRPTRCMRCGDQWVPLALENAPELPPPSPPSVPMFIVPAGPTAMDRLSHPPVKPRGRLGLWLAWIVTVLILIGLAAGLYVERTRVMTAWPPSQRLYTLFGLAPTQESTHRAPEAKREGAEHVDETQQHPADRSH